MNADLASCVWSLERIAEAVERLAEAAGLVGSRGNESLPRNSLIDAEVDDETLDTWLHKLGACIGVETDAVTATYGSLDAFLRRSAPSVLRLSDRGGYLLLLGPTKRGLLLVGPDHGIHEVERGEVRMALAAELERRESGNLDPILEAAGVTGRRRRAGAEALAAEFLADRRVTTAWLLRPGAAAPLRTQLREAGLWPHLSTLGATRILQYGLFIASWWLLGKGVLEGHLDTGWILAWGLLLFSLLPCQLIAAHAEGEVAIGFATILKRRMLFGATKMDVGEVRSQGVGQLMGQVFESEAIEQLALSGGFLTITAVVELLAATVVLLNGAGGVLHAMLLWICLGAALAMGWRCYQRQLGWTRVRSEMTNELVENMVGNRTRQAQEPRERWNEGEDRLLARYLDQSRNLDQGVAAMFGWIPRGWLNIGLLGLAVPFIAGDAETLYMAIGIGGILLGYQGFRNFVEGLARFNGAAIAWGRVSSLWKAASRTTAPGDPGLVFAAAKPASPKGRPVLEGMNLNFRYRGRARAILDDVDLEIRQGERILLEGSSGSGKSTLARLLSGSGSTDSGILLLNGLDQDTAGTEDWRRNVVSVPQFHHNHVLLGTLAFNLLLGRNWPPSARDLRRAEEVCHGLGLGPLLARMPAGLHQVVGETGWRLSHGEQSRVFMARAILQEPDVMLLDESFGPLDPETMEVALKFTLEQARTVINIAHP